MSNTEIWFWHIFALLLAFLFALPTFILKRIGEKFATHQPIHLGQVNSVHTQEKPLTDSETEWIVEAFNRAAFIQKKPREPIHSTVELIIELKSPVKAPRQTYRLYPYNGEVEVVREKGTKTTIYQIRSKELHDWLSPAADLLQ